MKHFFRSLVCALTVCFHPPSPSSSATFWQLGAVLGKSCQALSKHQDTRLSCPERSCPVYQSLRWNTTTASHEVLKTGGRHVPWLKPQTPQQMIWRTLHSPVIQNCITLPIAGSKLCTECAKPQDWGFSVLLSLNCSFTRPQFAFTSFNCGSNFSNWLGSYGQFALLLCMFAWYNHRFRWNSCLLLPFIQNEVFMIPEW